MVSAVLAGVLASNSMQGVPLCCLNASVRRPILFNTSGNRSTLTIGMCGSIVLRWAYSCACNITITMSSTDFEFH